MQVVDMPLVNGAYVIVDEDLEGHKLFKGIFWEWDT